MPRATIKIRFAKNGVTTVETQGIKGKRCLEVTKKLEEALGTVESSKLTKEYFEPPRRKFRKICVDKAKRIYKRIYLDKP